MAKDISLQAVLKLTSEMLRESAKAKHRAWKSLSTSTDMIAGSKKLLASWPVNGTPSLPQGQPLWEALNASSRPSAAVAAPAPDPQPADPVSALERIEGQTFKSTTLRLDGRYFADCTVESCVLEYWGGPVVLECTNFSGCRFSFAGEAAMTIGVLNCFGMLGSDQEHLVKPAGFAAAAPGSRPN